MVVFDGIESIRSLITDWYKARLTDSATGGTTRDDSKEDHETLNHDAEDYGAEDARGGTARPPVDEFRSAFNSDSEGKLEGIEIIEGPTIQDRGSAFVARVCRISHPSQVGSYVFLVSACISVLFVIPNLGTRRCLLSSNICTPIDT